MIFSFIIHLYQKPILGKASGMRSIESSSSIENESMQMKLSAASAPVESTEQNADIAEFPAQTDVAKFAKYSNGNEKDATEKRLRDVSSDELIKSGTIKRIMKIDKDVKMTSSEAVFLVSKATELFLGKAMETVHTNDTSLNNADPNTIMYNQIARTVKKHKELDFLVDLLPEV